jgi:putative SOS response-associated peptidase YedK
MPVVLDERDYGRWLADSEDPRQLLKACHNEALYNYPFSRQVNSVRNNDPSLVTSLANPDSL